MIDGVAFAWVASSSLGILAASAGTVEGIRDLKALGKIRNGRRRIARGYIRSQVIRLAICIAWLAIGIPIAVDDQRTPLNPLTAILVASNLGLAAAAWLDLLDRRQLQQGGRRNG